MLIAAPVLTPAPRPRRRRLRVGGLADYFSFGRRCRGRRAFRWL